MNHFHTEARKVYLEGKYCYKSGVLSIFRAERRPKTVVPCTTTLWVLRASPASFVAVQTYRPSSSTFTLEKSTTCPSWVIDIPGPDVNNRPSLVHSVEGFGIPLTLGGQQHMWREKRIKTTHTPRSHDNQVRTSRTSVNYSRRDVVPLSAHLWRSPWLQPTKSHLSVDGVQSAITETEFLKALVRLLQVKTNVKYFIITLLIFVRASRRLIECFVAHSMISSHATYLFGGTNSWKAMIRRVPGHSNIFYFNRERRDPNPMANKLSSEQTRQLQIGLFKTLEKTAQLSQKT